MSQPRVLILRAPGTNCDGETAQAFELAGGRPEIVHIQRALESPKLLSDFQILCIPGGFSYGDDIASGRIFAVQLKQSLGDSLHDFVEAGKLILGICNGFQVLAKCGLLTEAEVQQAAPFTLTWNTSGKFEDRWVHLVTAGQKCVLLSGIDSMYLPVAHGEGRFVARDPQMLSSLEGAKKLVLRYAPAEKAARANEAEEPIVPYPDNPNGSQANVAGMCDSTGRVFGLMPHPERHIDPLQHPRWTRGEAGQTGDGLRLFQNAVNYFR
jgi:phosphoribosylformylglycinamidine synthase subunit PurQ / glutaminase